MREKLVAGAEKRIRQLGSAKKPGRRCLPTEDPLRNLETFSVKGPPGKLTNTGIDSILYGGS